MENKKTQVEFFSAQKKNYKTMSFIMSFSLKGLKKKMRSAHFQHYVACTLFFFFSLLKAKRVQAK